MNAADVMVSDVIVVRPQDTVRDAAAVLLERRISAAPVVTEDGRLVGIVSEGDLMRRAEIGTHHHIAGRYLHAYADEMAWREDNRRKSNGDQFTSVSKLALAHPMSSKWRGYWR